MTRKGWKCNNACVIDYAPERTLTYADGFGEKTQEVLTWPRIDSPIFNLVQGSFSQVVPMMSRLEVGIDKANLELPGTGEDPSKPEQLMQNRLDGMVMSLRSWHDALLGDGYEPHVLLGPRGIFKRRDKVDQTRYAAVGFGFNGVTLDHAHGVPPELTGLNKAQLNELLQERMFSSDYRRVEGQADKKQGVIDGAAKYWQQTCEPGLIMMTTGRIQGKSFLPNPERLEVRLVYNEGEGMMAIPRLTSVITEDRESYNITGEGEAFSLAGMDQNVKGLNDMLTQQFSRRSN